MVPEDEDGAYFRTTDGTRLYVYQTALPEQSDVSIYVISGITGINHKRDRDLVDALSGGRHRVIFIHPYGTGYSDGLRGDIDDFSKFIKGQAEFISNDLKNAPLNRKIVLFGHSMAASIALKIAASLKHVDGMILVNPPYRTKKAKGMSPKPGDYVRYAVYAIFAPHTPIVNMSGNPTNIENRADREESEERNSDALLVKYFSMYYMMEANKTMKSMVEYSKLADFPLLLLYGDQDSLVDRTGCDEIFSHWRSDQKQFVIVKDGTHGKSTVVLSKEIIQHWLDHQLTSK
jgi:alpha-beta hydrolase superfamily lysophospholipase